MTRKINTLLFDWDGTLHNTKHLYGEAFRNVYPELVEAGYAPDKAYDDDTLSKFLGLNVIEAWAIIAPDLPVPVRDRAIKAVGDQMEDGIFHGKAELYPGVEAMLEKLKNQGYTMALLSNSKVSYIEAFRKHFDLDRFFSAYYPCEAFDFIPKEEIFTQIKNRHPEAYVMIGDRDSDLKVGAVHHLPTVACAYGYGSAEERQGASCVAKAPSDIPDLIESLNQNAESTD